MMHRCFMKKVTQDNEPLSFVKLAALTANVTRFLKLHEPKDEEREGNPEPCHSDKQRSEEHAKYVNHRLRELAAWERRIQDGAVRKRR
jgi:hypothetical protein